MIKISSDVLISQTRCNNMNFLLCSIEDANGTFYYILSAHGKKDIKYLTVNVANGLYSYYSLDEIMNDILKYGLKIYPNNYPSKLNMESGSKVVLEFTINDFEGKAKNILDIFVF